MGGLLQQGLDLTYQESGAGYQGGVLGGLLEGCSKRVVDLNGWMIGREKREEIGRRNRPWRIDRDEVELGRDGQEGFQNPGGVLGFHYPEDEGGLCSWKFPGPVGCEGTGGGRVVGYIKHERPIGHATFWTG